MILNKKAAMFGLDARIALAIFGALSIITGAALYSAINKAKITAIFQELQSYAKAYEEYILDTQHQIPLLSYSVTGLVTKDLITSDISGWRGPYLPYKVADMINTHSIKHNKFDELYFIRATDENTFGSYISDLAAEKTCNSNTLPCFVWIAYFNVPKQTAEGIDKMLDGSISANTGQIRIRYHSGGKYAVYYQVMPYQR